jgi:hypothetical protein
MRRRRPVLGDAAALLSASRAAVVRTRQLVERAQALFEKRRQLQMVPASPAGAAWVVR